MKKKILVTGGAGFIGSHLCEYLSKLSIYDIYSLDNYSLGSVDNHVNGVNYLKGEVSDIDNIINFKIDLIYHLGEYSRVEQSFDDIELVWKYNKNGIFSILQFCRKYNIKLIYAGSSTKFGDDGLGRSQSPYAWTKSSNTELVANYGSWFDLNFAITYFYNVYGGREISSGKYATLIGLFKNKYLNLEPLPVVSPGTQYRNFTHIDDIVSGLFLVGEYGYGDNYGIGSPEAYTILEIANMFSNNITMLPARKGNRMSASVITNKTELLGWKPLRNIKDHINDFKGSI
jgi:UDP-glucose 4-epimerase